MAGLFVSAPRERIAKLGQVIGQIREADKECPDPEPANRIKLNRFRSVCALDCFGLFLPSVAAQKIDKSVTGGRRDRDRPDCSRERDVTLHVRSLRMRLDDGSE